jgi:hypothetical protein
LLEYFLRCPFSQARMIEVTEQGKVLYKTERNQPGRFPDAASKDLVVGPERNFQVFDPLDFLWRMKRGKPVAVYSSWYKFLTGFLVRIRPRFALRRLMHYLNIQGSEDGLSLLPRERGND